MAGTRPDAAMGGNRSAMTEHVGKEWRRRQRFEVCMELEGADSVGEIRAGRNCGKQVRVEGKLLKHAFDCFDKCCSGDTHDVVSKQAFDYVDKI